MIVVRKVYFEYFKDHRENFITFVLYFTISVFSIFSKDMFPDRREQTIFLISALVNQVYKKTGLYLYVMSQPAWSPNTSYTGKGS